MITLLSNLVGSNLNWRQWSHIKGAQMISAIFILKGALVLELNAINRYFIFWQRILFGQDKSGAYHARDGIPLPGPCCLTKWKGHGNMRSKLSSNSLEKKKFCASLSCITSLLEPVWGTTYLVKRELKDPNGTTWIWSFQSIQCLLGPLAMVHKFNGPSIQWSSLFG